VGARGWTGVLWQWREAVAARHDAEVKGDARELALKEAVRTLHFNRLTLGHREWQANNVDRTLAQLELCPAELRHWEWHYLHRLCHADRFPGCDAEASPDHRRGLGFPPPGTRHGPERGPRGR